MADIPRVINYYAKFGDDRLRGLGVAVSQILPLLGSSSLQPEMTMGHLL